jgi:hypothetical protein
VAGWETVREIAGALTGAEESTTYGRPAFKVDGELFVRLSPDRAAEGALEVRVESDEKPFFIEAMPDRYFETPDYEGHPVLLVRLERIGREELAERIEDSWLLRAPKRLVDEFVAESEQP